MKPKLAMFTTSAELGGAEQFVVDCCRALHEHYELHVVLPADGPLAEVVGELDCSTHVIPYPPGLEGFSQTHGKGSLHRAGLAMAATVKRYIYFLRELRPQLIYSHGLKAEAMTAMASKVTGIPVLWHLHSYPPGGKTLKIYAKLATFTKLVLANSRSVGDEFSKATKTTASVLYNPVDPKRYFEMDMQESRRALSIEPDPAVFVIGMISAFAPWKGLHLAIQSLADWLRAHPDTRLLLVGAELYRTEGHTGYADSLRTMANELGLGQQIIFRDFQNEARVAYSACDVVLHASIKPEPFGRVVSEARACRRPVIAAAAGGVVEQVEHEKTGLLWPVGDGKALTDAVDRLWANESLRRTLADQGQAWVSEHLNFARFSEQLLDHLHSVAVAA